MSASVKFNGGNTLLVYDGAGSATLESLGLATAGEVARLKADLATAASVTKQLAEERDEARASGHLLAWDCATLTDERNEVAAEDERGHRLIDAADKEEPGSSSMDTLATRVERLLAELAAEREIQAALQESLAKEVTAHLETARERDWFKERLAHDSARWLECIRERDALKANQHALLMKVAERVRNRIDDAEALPDRDLAALVAEVEASHG